MTGTLSPVVRFEVADGVGTITLDRPKVNAYQIGLMSQLREAVVTADADPAVSVVLLRSALPTIFSVGADIKAWAANDAAQNQQLVDVARASANAMGQSDTIFIVLIEGHALGGGLELAMAADLRFAAEGEYLLGLPEVKLGLMPGNGGSQRLLRLVGPARALEMVATGESIGPVRALEIGLIDRLYPATELVAEAEVFARALASGPSAAIAAIKRSIRDGGHLPLAEGLALEARLSDQLYDTADGIEGFKAYVEKRPPRFGGDDSA